MFFEELWDVEEEKPFCKIFTRECLNAKGIQKIMQCTKTHLQDLSCNNDDYAVHYLQNHEVDNVCMLVLPSSPDGNGTRP